MAISSRKIDGLLGMVTLRLREDNFLKWRYQIEFVLEGHDIFGYFDGSVVPPPKFAILDEEGVTVEITVAYKDWLKIEKPLLSFLIATLSNDAIEYVIGSKTSRDAWLSLTDRYTTVSRARVNHLKTEFQTIQKGGDSIEQFLLRLKHIKDQLALAGVLISNDDLMLAALNGLPTEYAMIKTVLLACETSISFKEFCTHLLAAEQAAETQMSSLQTPMVAMIGHGSSTPRTSRDGLLPTPSTSINTPTGFHVHSRPSGSFGRGNFSGNRSFTHGGFSGNRPFSNGFSGHRSSSGVVPECQI